MLGGGLGGGSPLGMLGGFGGLGGGSALGGFGGLGGGSALGGFGGLGGGQQGGNPMMLMMMGFMMGIMMAKMLGQQGQQGQQGQFGQGPGQGGGCPMCSQGQFGGPQAVAGTSGGGAFAFASAGSRLGGFLG